MLSVVFVFFLLLTIILSAEFGRSLESIEHIVNMKDADDEKSQCITTLTITFLSAAATLAIAFCL